MMFDGGVVVVVEDFVYYWRRHLAENDAAAADDDDVALPGCYRQMSCHQCPGPGPGRRSFHSVYLRCDCRVRCRDRLVRF